MLFSGQRRIELVNLLGDHHLLLVNLGQVGEPVGVCLTVENQFAVQHNFQPALMDRGQLDCHITGVMGGPQLCRHPRGDGVIASSQAINDFNFYFAKFWIGHVPPKQWTDMTEV